MKNRAKIGPESDSEWQRQRKTTKIASGAVSGRTFRARARFLSILGSRPELKISSKPVPGKKCCGILAPGNQFFAFSSPGCVPEASRVDSGGSADPPGRDFATILQGFFGRFRRDLVVVCRVPPGGCRDTPSVSGTHSAGFLWGTAISRSELNNFRF